MYKSKSLSVLIFVLLLAAFGKLNGQTPIPDVLNKDPLKEQLKYLEEHTRIYEYYRAIREDMFQKIKVNISDTLLVSKNKIAALNLMTHSLNKTIDTLRSSLEATKTSLNDITRTKNSIRVFGIEINKVKYNSTMWTLIAVLVAVIALGFILFKRNLSVTNNTNKELRTLKDEFEAYRKTTREAREKMSMAHFNELKKLRGE